MIVPFVVMQYVPPEHACVPFVFHAGAGQVSRASFVALRGRQRRSWSCSPADRLPDVAADPPTSPGVHGCRQVSQLGKDQQGHREHSPTPRRPDEKHVRFRQGCQAELPDSQFTPVSNFSSCEGRNMSHHVGLRATVVFSLMALTFESGYSCFRGRWIIMVCVAHPCTSR